MKPTCLWVLVTHSRYGSQASRDGSRAPAIWAALLRSSCVMVLRHLETGSSPGSLRRSVEIIPAQCLPPVPLSAVLESPPVYVALLGSRSKMRTRESFRNYVRGMDRERLGRLLREAYADRGLPECDAKVKKRLVLLERSLGASYR